MRLKRSFLIQVLSLISGLLAVPAIGSFGSDSQMPSVSQLPVQRQMPDAMVMDDGRRVTTLGQWEQRRQEMKRVLIHYFIGTVPPPPGNVIGTVLDDEMLLGRSVHFQRIRLSFGPDHRVGFEIGVFVPTDDATHGKGPFPTIVQLTFSTTPGAPIAPWPKFKQLVKATTRDPLVQLQHLPVKPENAAKAVKFILDRGYALAVFNYQECGQDQPDCRNTGFFPFYPGYTWGEFGAWSWAMSRCVDYLQTQPYVDTSKFIAVGHSRLGKTALVAGAFDDRFAMVAPCGSGCAGTAAFRFCGPGRGGQQGLEDYVARFGQHLGPNMKQFIGHVYQLPFDQNWLVALVAPRALIECDGISDHVTNINALRQTILASKPVYEFLGVPQNLGVAYRPGKHALTAADWTALLDFADSRLRHLPTTRRFDYFPPSPFAAAAAATAPTSR